MRPAPRLVVFVSAGFLLFACSSTAQQPNVRPGGHGAAAKLLGQLPLDFELNQGQASSDARFIARGNGYSVYLGEDSSYVLAAAASPKPSPNLLRMRLANARKVSPQGLGPLAGTSNYFIGNSPARWHTGIPHFAKVVYSGVYPGIDLIYYGNQKQLEHDFVVAAGGDPREISFEISGANSVAVSPAGDLELNFREGKMVLARPLAYQQQNGESKPVACAYKISDENRVRFELGSYDRSRALVIDPVLIYSTLLGGSNNDEATGIALDAQGNAYVTGFTMSADFPLKGAIQAACAASCSTFDVFVAKLNSTGTALVYSTYIGGSGNDYGYAIAVDPNGNAYVTGYTQSTDFPLVNAAQSTFSGSFVTHAFVAKLNATGSALTYSTYLGGSGTESGDKPVTAAIAADASGNAYVVGGTNSTDFPVTAGAYQTTYGGTSGSGNSNGYLAKYGPTGSKLFATYFGGTGPDGIRGVALDSATPPNIYVTGDTASANFPATTGAFQTTCGSCNNNQSDAFVAKFTNAGVLAYATFLGGGQVDRGNAIAVDGSGNAYVTGSTTSNQSQFSTGFPVVGGVQSSCIGCNSFLSDSFITKVNASGTALVYSTYLGGDGDTEGTGIGVDSNGFAYVAGYTSAPNFLLSNPFQASGGGGVFQVSNTGAISPSSSGFANSSVGEFVADSTGIYAVAVNGNSNESFGLYKSTDGGNTWTKLTNAPTGINTIALDPSNAGTIYGAVGYQGFNNEVAKSTDGGKTWTTSTSGLPTGTTATTFDSIAVDGSNAKRVFVGTGAGIYLSTDAGLTFTSSSMGLPTPGFGSSNYTNVTKIIDDASTTPSTLYANLTGNAFGNSVIGIYKSTDGGASWTIMSSGLEPASTSSACCNNISSLAIDPNNHQVLYAGTPPNFAGGDGIFKTTNGGGSWTQMLATTNGATFTSAGSNITALALDSSSNIYAGLSGAGQRNGLVKSTDGGANWTDLGLDGDDVRALLPGSSTLAGTSDNQPAGGFSSTAFPAVAGGPTAFIARFNQAGDSLDYASYVGGTSATQASAIAVNPSTGDAFVAGTTISGFPVTSGAFDTTPHLSGLTFTGMIPINNGVNNDAFVFGYPGALPSTTVSVSATATDTAQTGGIFNSDPVTFAITVMNTGTNPAAGVTVSGTLPSNFTVPPTGTLEQCQFNSQTDKFFCALPTVLPAGQTATFNLNVLAALAGNFTVMTSVTGDSFAPASNSLGSSVQAESDLIVTKTMHGATAPFGHQVNVGDHVTVDITLVNQGPDADATASISDLLPAGLTNCTVITQTGFQPGVGPTGGNTNLLDTGLSQAARLVVDCIASQAGQQTNTVTASGANHQDPTKSKDTASDTISVNSQPAGVTITKTMNPRQVAVGDQVTISITVTNTGPNDASSVSITDSLPSRFYSPSLLAYDCGSLSLPAGWTGVLANSSLSAEIPSLPVSATATITFTCTVHAGGMITNTASMTYTMSPNPNPVTVTSMDTITAGQPQPPTTTPNPANFGSVQTTTTGGKLADQPIHLSNVSSLNLHPDTSSFACTEAGNVGSCTVTLGTCTGTVAPGSSCDFDLHQACTTAGGFSGTASFNDNTATGKESDNFSGSCSNNPGPATTLVVSGPLTLVSGTAGSVTVTAKDQDGNVATGYTGTVHFTSTDGKATLPADYTFVAGDKGTHTFTNGVTLNTTGNQTVTATDTVTSTITGMAGILVTGSKTATVTETITKGSLRKPSVIKVTVSSATAPTPTGTVVVVLDGAPQLTTTATLDANGQATLEALIPKLFNGVVGADVAVLYLGDGTYAQATSASENVVIPLGPNR